MNDKWPESSSMTNYFQTGCQKIPAVSKQREKALIASESES